MCASSSGPRCTPPSAIYRRKRDRQEVSGLIDSAHEGIDQVVELLIGRGLLRHYGAEALRDRAEDTLQDAGVEGALVARSGNKSSPC